jgi:hypothetical protein
LETGSTRCERRLPTPGSCWPLSRPRRRDDIAADHIAAAARRAPLRHAHDNSAIHKPMRAGGRCCSAFRAEWLPPVVGTWSPGSLHVLSWTRRGAMQVRRDQSRLPRGRLSNGIAALGKANPNCGRTTPGTRRFVGMERGRRTPNPR